MTIETILLAEADEAFARTAMDAFERGQYRCIVAGDAATALAHLESHKIGVAIIGLGHASDISMALVRDVVARDAHLPVIVIAPGTELSTAMECIELGVVAYVQQPVPVAQLLDSVREASARSRAVGYFEEFVAQTLRNVNGSLHDLTQLTSALRRRTVAAQPCQMLNCPRGSQLRIAIRDAIEVLAATKGAFKSKALGDLRHRLQLVLDSH